MSGSIPFDTGYDLWQGVDPETARKVTATLLPGVLSGVAGTVAPDTTLPYGLNILPFAGAAEGLTSFANTLYDVGRGAMKKIIGTNLPEAPAFMTQAGEHLADTQNKIYDFLPHYQPTSDEAKEFEAGKDFAQMIGGALPVTPGGPLNALPSGVRAATHFLMPTVEGTIGRVAATPPAAVALQYALTPQQAEATPQQGDQSAGDFMQTIGAAPQPNMPQPTAQSTPAPDIGTGDFQSFVNPPAPTFNEQGEAGPTWGQVAAGVGTVIGLLAGARYTHQLGVQVSDMARDARLSDPAYAAKAQDYNNEQVAVKAGQQISNDKGVRTPAPLPDAGKINAAAIAAQSQVLDDTANARNYVKLTSGDLTTYEKLANQYGTTHDQGRWQATLGEFLKTGVDSQSKVAMPSPERLFKDIGRLDQQQRKTLNDGLMAANEMDNRNYNYQRGIVGPEAMHDFATVPDQTLVGFTQKMLNDPALHDIAQRYWGIGKGMVDIGEARGFFSPTEASQMRAVRPNYVPEVNLEGKITHALGPRAMGGVAGIDQVNTDAWHAMAQHIEELTRQYDLADTVRNLTNHQLNVQKQNPNSAQFLHEVQNPYGGAQSLYPTYAPSGVAGREPVYSVRDGKGIKFYRSDSPEFYNFVKGQNSRRGNTLISALDYSRRFVQQATTGILSLATGRIFPPVHLARVSMTMQSNRPRGYAGSLSDAVMQRLTRGRVGQSVVYDPSNLAGIAYSFGRGQADKFANGLGEMLHPANPNIGTQIIKSIVGPKVLQDISDGLKNYYLGTVTHEMAAGGVSGTGTALRFIPPSIKLNGADIRLQSAKLARRAFMPPGKTGAVKAFAFRLRDALDAPYNDMMDAGNQYFYRLNRYFNPDIDRNGLVYESRALVGNPSTHGASQLVQGMTHAVPYSNIALQAQARRVRGFNEAPISYSASVVGQLGSLAMLSILTAMRNPDTLQHLQNMISTQQRAANIVVYGDDDPQKNTQISLPQEVRWIYPMMLDIVGKALNLTAAMHDPVSFDNVYTFLKDWFSEHIENSTVESMLHGAADATSYLEMPPMMQAVSILGGGGEVSANMHDIVRDYQNQGVNLNTFVFPVGTDHALPNHPVADNMFEGTDGKKWSKLFSTLFGQVGGMLDLAIGLDHNQHALGNFLDAAGQTADDWWQKAKDANGELSSILWENTAKESLRPPVVEFTERRLHNMQAAGGPRSSERMEGTTGGAHPLPITPQSGEDRNVPKDPAMRNLYFTVQAEHSWLQSHFVAGISQIKKQMMDASNQPMDNTQKRQWMNNQTRVIADKYRIINQFIDDQNTKVSNIYNKRIDIGGPIDWKKGMDQFSDLN